MLNQSDDYKSKRSFLISEENCILKVIESEGELRMKMMDRKVMSLLVGIAFYRNSFLHSSFNIKIKHVISSGILKKFSRFKAKYLTKYKKQNALKIGENSNPVVLTMEHLSVGFLIWIGMLLISFIIFVINFTNYWAPKLFGDCFGSVALYIVTIKR